MVPVSYFFGVPRSEIWQIDTSAGSKALLFTLATTGSEVRGKGITGLTWLDDLHLVACDFNRLLKLDRKTFSIDKAYEDEELNDLHSLSIDENNIHLANAGRDSIDVFNHQLELLERIDCLSSDEWQKRKAGDYTISGSYFDSLGCGLPFHRRRVPDKWHFNHVIKTPKSLGDKVVATSFTARCLLDVQTLEPVSSSLPTQPHDGFLHGDFLWITTVSGQIHRAPLKIPFEFEMVCDLFNIAPYQGWCRGLLIAEGSMFVGITSIYEASRRTDWLNSAIEDTRSGIYQLSMSSMEVEAFYDFSSTDGSRIFTMIEDR